MVEIAAIHRVGAGCLRRASGLGLPMLFLSTLLAGCGQEEQILHSKQYEWTGRCMARIEPAAAEVQAAVVQAFVAQNGADWQSVAVEPFTREVNDAMRGPLVHPPRDPMMITEPEAVRMTTEFAAKNADFLGIAPGDIDDLSASARYNPYKGPLQWSVSLNGVIPVRGYEALLPEGRRSRINISIAKDGDLYQLLNRSELIPEFDICTEPRLAADDPRLAQQVLGRVLEYADFAGALHQVGPVLEEHIVATTLTIHIRHDADERVVLVGLAYRLDVQIMGLPWAMIVDPDTGSLIEIQQRFTS